MAAQIDVRLLPGTIRKITGRSGGARLVVGLEFLQAQGAWILRMAVAVEVVDVGDV